MENAIPNKSKLIIFDLKGSTVDRHVGGFDSEDPPTGIVLKDLNLKRYGNKIIVDKRDEAIKILLDDVKVLRNSKLMDYSMLLSIRPQSDRPTRYSLGKNYSIAIIDFFQKYGFTKSVERVWKRYILRKTKGISAIPPIRYYKRIKKYIKDIIVD